MMCAARPPEVVLARAKIGTTTRSLWSRSVPTTSSYSVFPPTKPRPVSSVITSSCSGECTPMVGWSAECGCQARNRMPATSSPVRPGGHDWHDDAVSANESTGTAGQQTAAARQAAGSVAEVDAAALELVLKAPRAAEVDKVVLARDLVAAVVCGADFTVQAMAEQLSAIYAGAARTAGSS